MVNLVFQDIANIHAVRGSLNTVTKACSQTSADDPYAGVGSSGWMWHLHTILRGAVEVSETLQAGEACLVHCSDGWDRTSQITSLVMLLIDPSYRTIRGFCQLIQKEWCAFGHMFERRCGEHGKAYERDDSSPVFVQWLDAVHQVLRQFPTEFEFDQTLLFALIEAVYSKWFGTFLLDSELERSSAGLSECTISFWDYVLSNIDEFANPLYEPAAASPWHDVYPVRIFLLAMACLL